MASNPEYFAQVRARGLCWICRRPMRDDDPRLAHYECGRAQDQGRTVADVRAQPPALGPLRPYEPRRR